MTLKKATLLLSCSLFTLLGCNKEVTPVNGNWVIRYFNSFHATTPVINTLCNEGGQTVLDISGTVDRDFFKDGASSPFHSQSSVALMPGNLSSNKSYTSSTHHLTCDELSVGVWNRSYLAVTLLGASTDGYATVGTDATGNCIAQISKPRSSQWVTVVVSYPGNENLKTVNGQTYSDLNNRQSAFTVNCENNGYIQQLRVNPGTGKTIKLGKVLEN